jgi:hypothetical protein
MKNLEKFLEFNGKRISILRADGTWFVALRPILDALNVDTERHLRNVKMDDILAQHLSEQTGVAADTKLRKMTCLPEKFIYGWLFTINSDSIELRQFKELCYNVLYNHFHGALTGRMNALAEKSETELKILDLQEKLETQLLESNEYQEIQELKKKQKNITRTLKDLDIELLQGQLSLNFS